MKHTLKKITLSTALATVLLTSSLTAGSVGGFGGALEVTQWMRFGFDKLTKWPKELLELQNNLKKFQKWKDQMMAYKSLVGQIGRFPKQIKARFMNDLLQMKKAVEFGDALSFTAASFDKDFKKHFKDYEGWLELAEGGKHDFQKTYKELNEASRDTVQGAMKALKLQESDLKSDSSFMHAIHSRMKDAKGEKEMLLIANELAVHQTERMKALQKTMMTQINMQGEFLAKNNTEDIIKQAGRDAFMSKKVKINHNDNVPMP